MTNKKSFWSNGWVIGIGTAILATLLTRGIDAIFDTKILSGIGSFFKSIIQELAKGYSIPLWLIILASVLVVFLLFAFVVVRSALSGSTVVQQPAAKLTNPPFIDYKSDVFQGVLYKWHYYIDHASGRVEIINIIPYCPDDKAQLYGDSCLLCNKFFHRRTESEVRILIQHKIENNLYPR